MSDSPFPPPLGDELLSATDRAILRSAAGDAPGPNGKANLLRALGAAGVVGAASAVGTASQAATIGQAAASATGGLGAATVLKVGATLAVVGALAGGAWTVSHAPMRDASAPRPIAIASSAPLVTATEAPIPASPLPPPVPPAPVVLPAPGAMPPAITPRVTRQPPQRAHVDGDDLEQEASALATARAALSRGDAPAAIAALDRYDASYPSGQLRREASILRARAISAIP